MRTWDWPGGREGGATGWASSILGGTWGCVGGMKARYWRKPTPPVFSFKSRHAIQESFGQRRALKYWEPGGSEGTSWCGVPQYSGDPAGGAQEEQAIPEKTLRGPLEPQVLQDNLTLSLAEVLQVSLSVPSMYHPVTHQSGVSR